MLVFSGEGIIDCAVGSSCCITSLSSFSVMKLYRLRSSALWMSIRAVSWSGLVRRDSSHLKYSVHVAMSSSAFFEPYARTNPYRGPSDGVSVHKWLPFHEMLKWFP